MSEPTPSPQVPTIRRRQWLRAWGQDEAFWRGVATVAIAGLIGAVVIGLARLAFTSISPGAALTLTPLVTAPLSFLFLSRAIRNYVRGHRAERAIVSEVIEFLRSPAEATR